MKKETIVKTIPAMAGYIFLGSAFGILVEGQNISLWVALGMSIFIYAGSMQFAAVGLLMNPVSLIQTFIISFSINARHLFYAITMLKPFQNIGKRKPYMIFGLTDVSFSMVLDEHEHDVMYHMIVLNHLYWIVGTLIGYLIGSSMTLPTQGIEFSMTAIFLLIFVDKVKEKKPYPTVLGLSVGVVCLIVFNANFFIIPSMIGIIMGLSYDFTKLPLSLSSNR